MTADMLNALRNGFMTTTPAKFQTLYHGTDDLQFALTITQKYGWHSPQAFRATYCTRALGGTSIYGPGIYLADTKKESLSYGQYIVEFTVHRDTDFLDMSDPQISKNATKLVGGGKQTILADPNVDALLRVTNNYFVLRTPFLVSAHLHP